MADFSIQDVAFTGFRVVRQHPRALLAWWLYTLATSLSLGALFVALAGADFMKLLALNSQPPRDPSEVLALMARLAPEFLGFVVLSLVANAILGAAMIRATYRPEDNRFGYLRLGGDELRQLGLFVLALLVFLAAYFGVAIVVALLALVAPAVRAGPDTLVGVMFICLAPVMLFLIVRFSLAPAMTFETRRINLFGSWALTRGRFWRLAGPYLLTIALVAVVYLLSSLVIWAVGAILAGGDTALASKMPDLGSLTRYFSPARLIQAVMHAALDALIWPVLFTPPAMIYRALSPGFAPGDAFA